MRKGAHACKPASLSAAIGIDLFTPLTADLHEQSPIRAEDLQSEDGYVREILEVLLEEDT